MPGETRLFGRTPPGRRISRASWRSIITPWSIRRAIWNDALVDLENRRQWWRGRTEAGFPVLVAVDRAAAGMALTCSAMRAMARSAPFDGYRQTVEQSVYVAESARRRGVGPRRC